MARSTAKEVENPNKEELITIKLPLVKDEKEDKRVWVNMRQWTIKRGIAVNVPKSVYEVLEASERMERLAFDYEAQMAN